MTTFRVLGPVRADRDGRPLDLGGPKQRAVLAALLLDAGRVVSTDRLVEAVWGNHPPTSTSASLQAYISNLRRALREDPLSASPIVRRNPGYLITIAADALDATTFVAGCGLVRQLVLDGSWSEAITEAESALRLWRGPLVQEFADEEWVRRVAIPVEERRMACQQDLVTALVGQRRLSDALAWTTDLIRSHPLDERACWLHVLTLHRLGRTADALSALAGFTRTLDDELGLRPGPALRDLQRAVLTLEPALEMWPNSTAATAIPGVVEPPAAAPEPGMWSAPAPHGPPLIGRHAQLAAAAATWAISANGGSPWVLVTGPAGIGKSRFAQEAAVLWREACDASPVGTPQVVHVSCPDDEALPAWWTVRQLLEGLGKDAGSILGSPEGLNVEVTRFAVYDRTSAWLAEVASTRSLLIVIDDVHWADLSSLGLLAHLAETQWAPRVAWLLTARDEIETCADGRLVSACVRRPDGRKIGLPALTPAEVSELVTQISGEAPDTQELSTLMERTGGNAFFVTEYARVPLPERADGQVPPAVRVVMESRLTSLGANVVAVLQTAAVMGEPLDLVILRQVCGLDNETLADRLDAAADAHVLVPETGGYAFAHALLRDVASAGLSPLRAQLLHRQIAEALKDRTDSDSLARRARHLLGAGPTVDSALVVQGCQAIARDAVRRWDSVEAVRWSEAALKAHDDDGGSRASQRDDLVVALLDALVRAGQGQRMLAVVDSSLLQAWRDGRTGSVGRVASILLRLTGAWPWPAYGTHPSALMSRLAGLESQLREHPPTHARVLAAMGVGSCYDMDPAVPDTLSSRAIAVAESTGDPDALADALLARAILYGGVVGRATETLSLLDRLSRLRHQQERFDEVISHGIASKTTLALGDLGATTTHVRAGATLSAALRLPVSRAQFRWAEYCLAAWQSDDLPATERLIDAAYRQHQQTELTQSISVVFARLGARWDQGRLGEGVGQIDNPYIASWITSIVAAARGDGDAVDLLATEIARPETTVWTSHGRWTLLGHAVADTGDASLAHTISAHLMPLSGAIGTLGHVAVLGPVDLALARVYLSIGELDHAQTALNTATTTASRAQSANWQLRCRVVGLQLATAAGERPNLDAVQRAKANAQARGLNGLVRDLDRLCASIQQDAERAAQSGAGAAAEVTWSRRTTIDI